MLRGRDWRRKVSAGDGALFVLVHCSPLLHVPAVLVDLVLLTTLEAGRITDSLLPLLRPLLPPTAASIDAALTVSRTQSDLLWHLSAFCGTYNSGAHVSHRFNAGMALERYAALLDGLPSGSSAGSAMVYTVEPPLTAFNPTAPSDLQVRPWQRAVLYALTCACD